MTQKPELPYIPWREDTRGFEELIEAYYTYRKCRKDSHAVEAIYALTALDDARVFDTLMKIWGTGHYLPALCFAFAWRGDVRALPVLRKFVQENPNWDTAKWAIGMLGEPDYLEDLLKRREELRGFGIYDKPLQDEDFAEALEHIKNHSPR